jgi:DNA polymerase-3 subunit epsilon
VWGWISRSTRTRPARPPEPPPIPLDSKLDIPEFIVAVDVETTGLHSTDRIVSLGAVWVSRAALLEGCLAPSFIHLIFDPGRRSHPEAERAHGFDDWLLRHQEPFGSYAAPVARFLDSGELILAHNADFDLGFLRRELGAEGQKVRRRVQCTMQAYRKAHGGSASLNAACAAVGLRRQGAIHGALEDAWLALMLFLWLKGFRQCAGFDRCGAHLEPFNLLPAPPRPEGALPRRKRARRVLAK